MSKIKNGGLDQYGAEPFDQQQFETAGVEWVNSRKYQDGQLAKHALGWSEAGRNKVVGDDVRRESAAVTSIMLIIIIIRMITAMTERGHHLLPSQRRADEHRPVVQRFRHCAASQQ